MIQIPSKFNICIFQFFKIISKNIVFNKKNQEEWLVVEVLKIVRKKKDQNNQNNFDSKARKNNFFLINVLKVLRLVQKQQPTKNIECLFNQQNIEHIQCRSKKNKCKLKINLQKSINLKMNRYDSQNHIENRKYDIDKHLEDDSNQFVIDRHSLPKNLY
ncbi:hypothetical protein ABPG74_006938 [Tetrahymena malaccensis]